MRLNFHSGWRGSAWCLATLAALLLTSASPNLHAADLVAIESLGLRVARGFRVTLFADSDLANDIYAMTLDARGHVVVTSQGYVRTLLDNNGDGVADTAIDLATTRTGGMGICFDGNDFYFSGDGYFSAYRDANGDGQTYGLPERIFPLAFAEHGGHAMRQGPDGWWYLIAGNETRFTEQHNNLPGAPIRQIEGGALLRISPDGKHSEAIAHGFRNPYDFDFNWLGDVFTYDSDVESDLFLPWYSPTRLYHVAYGGHHGWRLEGWRRSWARPDYYADTVNMLAPMGRGSPTGVASYRHNQFPPYYRDGFFTLDWTFGKVYFVPLAQNGSSYQTTPEVFLEPIGDHGFAPTDAVVAPDGSLLISIGGRKTRGAIYRIEYPAAGNPAFFATNWLPPFHSELHAVLNAPQPLDAWSRAEWMPIATRLGSAPFEGAVTDGRLTPGQRVRAVEVLTELHGGLPTELAAAGAQANSPFVRARVAWSIGRAPCDNFAPILLSLAKDSDSLVRRCAMDALLERIPSLDVQTVQQALAANLSHPVKRIHLLAARLATHLSDPAWKALWAQLEKGLPQARLSGTLALLWRNPPTSSIHAPAIETALSVLAQSKAPDHRLQAIRLIILALGDYHLQKPSIEVYTAYEPALPLTGHETLLAKVRQATGALLPSGDAHLNFETARLLAMLEDNTAETPRKILSLITVRSSPSADFHYLTALSRLKGPFPTNANPAIAHAILNLDRKLAGLEKRNKQNWTTRLSEVSQALLRREPSLAGDLARHPDFATASHLTLVASLGSDHYLPCARQFLAAVYKDRNFAWSGQLIDLLAALPPEEVRPLFRKQWPNVTLRDELILKLGEKPELIDRDKFITGLSSVQLDVVRASMSALLQLPRDETGKIMIPTMRLLRRLLGEPRETTLRAQWVALFNWETGASFKVQEQFADAPSLKLAYQPAVEIFNLRYPNLIRSLDDEPEDPAQWNFLLKTAPWDRGNAARGESLFRDRGCQACHTSATPLGPDLGGVTGRFSQTDLFNAILYPNREVAAPYRTTLFQTHDGHTYTGLVAYESADGVILRTGATSTLRLADTDIASRQPSNLSLMPSGLLAGLKPLDLADLYSYLKTLTPR